MSLITAVINWLTEIPGSSFVGGSGIEDLKNPKKLTSFLKLFVSKEDLQSQAFGDISFGDIKIDKETAQKYSYVDSIITSFCNRSSDKDIYFLPSPVNWNLIVENDEDELQILCGALLRIATNSLTISSLAYATIEFLDESDKMVIREYLNLPYHDSLRHDKFESNIKSMIEEMDFQESDGWNSNFNKRVPQIPKVNFSPKKPGKLAFDSIRAKYDSQAQSVSEIEYNEEFVRALILENTILENVLQRVTQ